MSREKLLAFLLGFLLSSFSTYWAQELELDGTMNPPLRGDEALVPITGQSVPLMKGFEKELSDLLIHWRIPGAVVSVVHKGKLVYSRGFGLANIENERLVQPDSLFRIGSISKIFTAVATLKLVQEKRLSLDARAFPLLQLPPENKPFHTRSENLNRITIRQLLECSGGWDRNNGGDPMFMPIAKQAAFEYSNSMRPTPMAIIRYQACRGLDFVPGSRFSYSNFGYCILGQIISKVSGSKYEEYVRENLLLPLKLNSARAGKTREVAPGEVSYYGYPGERESDPIMPNVRGPVPQEYGGDFYLEAMTADCGWVCTASDLALFVSSVLGERGKQYQPLSRQLTELMFSRPDLPDWKDQDHYFAMGWEIEKTDTKNPIIKKEGCLPGTTALAFHRDKSTFVIVFNTRPQMTETFQDEVSELISKTQAAQETKWKTE